MTRGLIASVALFLALGAGWACYDPLAARIEVARLSDPANDHASTEASLLRRGRGALWALRAGARSGHPSARIRCARLLALQGDDGYEELLLQVLARGKADPDSALAEVCLLSIWDFRNGPEPRRLAEWVAPDAGWRRSERAVNELLGKHPAWVGGYIFRGRHRLNEREIRGALEDAKIARLLEPSHFEAYALLGDCYRLLDFPEAAVACYEEALEINPRLNAVLAERLEKARQDAAGQRKLRLEERTREWPAT